MLKIGLTGGMGVGKTTILREFEKLGTPIYMMDNRLKTLIKENEELRTKLTEFLGPNVFDENNEYNRKYVSEVIFNDRVKKADLCLIFDRYLKDDLYAFYDNNKQESYVVVESAVFYEYDMDNLVDFMVGVNANFEVRMSRIKARDLDQDEKQIMAKINNQIPQEEKMGKCDIVIENGGDVNVAEIKKIHDLFTKIDNLKRIIFG